MLERVTAENFAPHVGDRFVMHLADGQTVALTLIAAEQNGKQQPGAQRAPFALLFRPPPGVVPAQQLYRLVHEQLGELEIFLVPVTPDAEGPRLEAVFT